MNKGGKKMQKPGFRDLKKHHLGGVVFGCTKDTMQECLNKQLFGLPSTHFNYVKNIDSGLPLFLFNYSDRKLYGIFEAASCGQMNIDPYGWTLDGSKRTHYPAQVQVRVRLQCQPVLEQKFKPVISNNYYSPRHFWFELDHGQSNKLLSLLASSAVAPSASLPLSAASLKNTFQAPPSNGKNHEAPEFRTVSLELEHLNYAADQKLDFEDGADAYNPSGSDADHGNQSSGKSDSTDFASVDLLENHLDAKETLPDEKDVILMKLREMASSLTPNGKESAPLNDRNIEGESVLTEQTDSLQKIDVNACANCRPTIAQLIQGMEEFKLFKAEQSVKMSYMEQKLVEAEKEIEQLKERCIILGSMPNSNQSMEDVNDMAIESSDELDLDPSTSIFVVGGYDGESWLSTLDLYSPSQDVIKSLCPMSSVRSYASAVQLNGELFVFGGGDGYTWYDTVESYSSSNDHWTLCPSLAEKKGSLAGASLDGKIFAIGGGNGVQCFSDVEMLDLDIGRWIRTRSMLQKRFAVAAVELNGSIYAVGGYDGNEYLMSAERFDPREHSWSKIPSMSTRRGCHSLVVSNEKLYALGGFDGIAMVPSIEIFDPRLGSWMNGHPMNQPRGYSAASVIEGSIHVIGGVREGHDIVATVECYKEGLGWQEKSSRAVGKRCFMSTVSLSK